MEQAVLTGNRFLASELRKQRFEDIIDHILCVSKHVKSLPLAYGPTTLTSFLSEVKKLYSKAFPLPNYLTLGRISSKSLLKAISNDPKIYLKILYLPPILKTKTSQT